MPNDITIIIIINVRSGIKVLLSCHLTWKATIIIIIHEVKWKVIKKNEKELRSFYIILNESQWPCEIKVRL